MPIREPNLICTLTLADKERRNPVIQLAVENETIACIDTGEPDPHIPLPDTSIRSVSAMDILEHVHDEQAWLAEFARILAPEGELIARVPLDNALGWMDALNIYRYISDTVHLGTMLKETMPLGWHRHYTMHDFTSILTLAGFEVESTHHEGVPLSEIPHLAKLLVGNIVLKRPDTEAQLFEERSDGRHRKRPAVPAPLAACLTVHAKHIRQGFDPDPDLDQADRPEKEATTPIE